MSEDKFRKLVKEQGIDPEITQRKEISIVVSCKDCIYYTKHATYTRPCKSLGIEKTDTPCTRFMPDLPRKTSKQIYDLLNYCNKASIDAETLLALIPAMQKANKSKFHFGQSVSVDMGQIVGMVQGCLAGVAGKSAVVLSQTGNFVTVPLSRLKRK